MKNLPPVQLWLVIGSQHLYGPETLQQVANNATKVADFLREKLPVDLVLKPVMTDADAVYALCRAAVADDSCIGLVCWMHTFSPAKMWIRGLSVLNKPLCHLHTQFYRDIPYATIDMDYMNLHQTAHGGREFGHLCARLDLPRRVIVGHWRDERVTDELSAWARVARGIAAERTMKVARLGDNMREVSVTEGDKVAAQQTFGYSVNGYGMAVLKEHLMAVSESEIKQLVETYEASYELDDNVKAGGSHRANLRESARQEIALRAFLEAGGFTAFTDTFENLTGLKQLPGLAVQRLMADGYGFGAEGDWKTAALVRTMKVMSDGLPGGNSFMEDYTYHFAPGEEAVLGAHMLEICPSITVQKPRLGCHPLGIGGKADPCRLVFDGAAGPALNASLVDMGNRFRLLVNPVIAVSPPEPLPNLPVARVLWQPSPDLTTAATEWIYGGGAHHTCYSQNVSVTQLRDYAQITGAEWLLID